MECTQVLESSQNEPESAIPHNEIVGRLFIEKSDECERADYELKNGENKVGRDSTACSICIQDVTISRLHAVILCEGTRYYHIYDVGSSNGTFIKSRGSKYKLKPRVHYNLCDGDQITLGSIVTTFTTDLSLPQVIDDTDSETGSESLLPAEDDSDDDSFFGFQNRLTRRAPAILDSSEDEISVASSSNDSSREVPSSQPVPKTDEEISPFKEPKPVLFKTPPPKPVGKTNSQSTKSFGDYKNSASTSFEGSPQNIKRSPAEPIGISNEEVDDIYDQETQTLNKSMCDIETQVSDSVRSTGSSQKLSLDIYEMNTQNVNDEYKNKYEPHKAKLANSNKEGEKEFKDNIYEMETQKISGSFKDFDKNFDNEVSGKPSFNACELKSEKVCSRNEQKSFSAKAEISGLCDERDESYLKIYDLETQVCESEETLDKLHGNGKEQKLSQGIYDLDTQRVTGEGVQKLVFNETKNDGSKEKLIDDIHELETQKLGRNPKDFDRTENAGKFQNSNMYDMPTQIINVGDDTIKEKCVLGKSRKESGGVKAKLSSNIYDLDTQRLSGEAADFEDINSKVTQKLNPSIYDMNTQGISNERSKIIRVSDDEKRKDSDIYSLETQTFDMDLPNSETQKPKVNDNLPNVSRNETQDINSLSDAETQVLSKDESGSNNKVTPVTSILQQKVNLPKTKGQTTKECNENLAKNDLRSSTGSILINESLLAKNSASKSLNSTNQSSNNSLFSLELNSSCVDDSSSVETPDSTQPSGVKNKYLKAVDSNANLSVKEKNESHSEMVAPEISSTPVDTRKILDPTKNDFDDMLTQIVTPKSSGLKKSCGKMKSNLDDLPTQKINFKSLEMKENENSENMSGSILTQIIAPKSPEMKAGKKNSENRFDVMLTQKIIPKSSEMKENEDSENNSDNILTQIIAPKLPEMKEGSKNSGNSFDTMLTQKIVSKSSKMKENEHSENMSDSVLTQIIAPKSPEMKDTKNLENHLDSMLTQKIVSENSFDNMLTQKVFSKSSKIQNKNPEEKHTGITPSKKLINDSSHSKSSSNSHIIKTNFTEATLSNSDGMLTQIIEEKDDSITKLPKKGAKTVVSPGKLNASAFDEMSTLLISHEKEKKSDDTTFVTSLISKDNDISDINEMLTQKIKPAFKDKPIEKKSILEENNVGLEKLMFQKSSNISCNIETVGNISKGTNYNDSEMEMDDLFTQKIDVQDSVCTVKKEQSTKLPRCSTSTPIVQSKSRHLLNSFMSTSCDFENMLTQKLPRSEKSKDITSHDILSMEVCQSQPLRSAQIEDEGIKNISSGASFSGTTPSKQDSVKSLKCNKTQSRLDAISSGDETDDDITNFEKPSNVLKMSCLQNQPKSLPLKDSGKLVSNSHEVSKSIIPQVDENFASQSILDDDEVMGSRASTPNSESLLEEETQGLENFNSVERFGATEVGKRNTDTEKENKFSSTKKDCDVIKNCADGMTIIDDSGSSGRSTPDDLIFGSLENLAIKSREESHLEELKTSAEKPTAQEKIEHKLNESKGALLSEGKLRDTGFFKSNSSVENQAVSSKFSNKSETSVSKTNHSFTRKQEQGIEVEKTSVPLDSGQRLSDDESKIQSVPSISSRSKRNTESVGKYKRMLDGTYSDSSKPNVSELKETKNKNVTSTLSSPSINLESKNKTSVERTVELKLEEDVKVKNISKKSTNKGVHDVCNQSEPKKSGKSENNFENTNSNCLSTSTINLECAVGVVEGRTKGVTNAEENQLYSDRTVVKLKKPEIASRTERGKKTSDSESSDVDTPSVQEKLCFAGSTELLASVKNVKEDGTSRSSRSKRSTNLKRKVDNEISTNKTNSSATDLSENVKRVKKNQGTLSADVLPNEAINSDCAPEAEDNGCKSMRPTSKRKEKLNLENELESEDHSKDNMVSASCKKRSRICVDLAPIQEMPLKSSVRKKNLKPNEVTLSGENIAPQHLPSEVTKSALESMETESILNTRSSRCTKKSEKSKKVENQITEQTVSEPVSEDSDSNTTTRSRRRGKMSVNAKTSKERIESKISVLGHSTEPTSSSASKSFHGSQNINSSSSKVKEASLEDEISAQTVARANLVSKPASDLKTIAQPESTAMEFTTRKSKRGKPEEEKPSKGETSALKSSVTQETFVESQSSVIELTSGTKSSRQGKSLESHELPKSKLNSDSPSSRRSKVSTSRKTLSTVKDEKSATSKITFSSPADEVTDIQADRKTRTSQRGRIPSKKYNEDLSNPGKGESTSKSRSSRSLKKSGNITPTEKSVCGSSSESGSSQVSTSSGIATSGKKIIAENVSNNVMSFASSETGRRSRVKSSVSSSSRASSLSDTESIKSITKETSNLKKAVTTPSGKKTKKSMSSDTNVSDLNEGSCSSSPMRKPGLRKVDLNVSIGSPTRSSRFSTRKTSTSAEKHHIMFTGLDEKLLAKFELIVNNLGGVVEENPMACTVLVTDKVRRTIKFLSTLAQGKPIVSIKWLEISNKVNAFRDPFEYLLQDKQNEQNFGFKLAESLTKAISTPLLAGYFVFVTQSVKPEPSQMKAIIESCGGKFLTKQPSLWNENSFIVSTVEDKRFWPKENKSKFYPKIVSAEIILRGVLQQKLDFQSYSLL